MEKKKKDKDMPVDELLEQLKLVFNIEDETTEKAKDVEGTKPESNKDSDALPEDAQNNDVKGVSGAEKKKEKKKFSIFARKKNNEDEPDDIEPNADGVSDDGVIEDFSFLNDELTIAPLKVETADNDDNTVKAVNNETPVTNSREAEPIADGENSESAENGEDAESRADGDVKECEPITDAAGDKPAVPDVKDESVTPDDAEIVTEASADKHAESAFSFLFEDEDEEATEKAEDIKDGDGGDMADNADGSNDGDGGDMADDADSSKNGDGDDIADDADGSNDDGDGGDIADDADSSKNGDDDDKTDDADDTDDIFVFTPLVDDDDVKTSPVKSADTPVQEASTGTRVMDKLPISDDDDIFLSEDEYKLKAEEEDRAKKDREATILHDVSEFDSLFDDENSEDGSYSSSEKAIMNALDEAPKPVKKKKLSAKKQAENDDEEFMSRVSALSGNTENGKSRRGVYEVINEYTSITQRSDFIAKYKKRYDKAGFALFGSSVFALMMLVYECLALFGAKLPQFCSPTENPAVFILIDLQLFVFCAAFAYKELLIGIRSIFNGSASAESLGALAALLTVLYGIISAFVRTEASGLFMLPAALAVICMLSASQRRIKRTVLAFKITSSKTGGKYVLDLCKPDETDGVRAAFGDYLPENPLMMKVNRADFIEGFVEQSTSPSKSLSSVNIFLPFTALVFAAVFGVLILTGKGAADSVQYAYIASMICVPVSFFTAVTFPAYSASKKAFGDDSCIVSDAGADEYARASIVAFDDSDVFPVANDKINAVKLYDENRIDHITYLVTSVFSKLGGPLKDIFDSVRADSDCCENTDIASVEADGVAANVNAEVVLIGSAAYIERNGITPDDKYSREDNLEETSGRARVMFVVANRRIVAKFRISYKADKDFIGLLKQLSEASRCVAIKTLDPNIDTELLKSDINTKKYTVEVIKCKNADELGHRFPTSSANVISKRSPKALLRTLLLCDKMSFSTKTNVLICFLSVLIGLLVTLFMIITGTMDKLNSIYITLYHLIFVAAVAIATKLYI